MGNPSFGTNGSAPDASKPRVPGCSRELTVLFCRTKYNELMENEVIYLAGLLTI